MSEAVPEFPGPGARTQLQATGKAYVFGHGDFTYLLGMAVLKRAETLVTECTSLLM